MFQDQTCKPISWRRRVRNKLRDKTGASLSVALLAFVVCAVVGSVILAAATATSARLKNADLGLSNRLALESAADLLTNRLAGGEMEMKVSTNADTDPVTSWQRVLLGDDVMFGDAQDGKPVDQVSQYKDDVNESSPAVVYTSSRAGSMSDVKYMDAVNALSFNPSRKVFPTQFSGANAAGFQFTIVDANGNTLNPVSSIDVDMTGTSPDSLFQLKQDSWYQILRYYWNGVRTQNAADAPVEYPIQQAFADQYETAAGSDPYTKQWTWSAYAAAVTSSPSDTSWNPPAVYAGGAAGLSPVGYTTPADQPITITCDATGASGDALIPDVNLLYSIDADFNITLLLFPKYTAASLASGKWKNGGVDTLQTLATAEQYLFIFIPSAGSDIHYDATLSRVNANEGGGKVTFTKKELVKTLQTRTADGESEGTPAEGEDSPDGTKADGTKEPEYTYSYRNAADSPLKAEVVMDTYLKRRITFTTSWANASPATAIPSDPATKALIPDEWLTALTAK